MVLLRTNSKRLTANGSFREIIYKFQDCNIEKKYIRTLERKNKKLQNNKDSILLNQTCLNIHNDHENNSYMAMSEST